MQSKSFLSKEKKQKVCQRSFTFKSPKMFMLLCMIFPFKLREADEEYLLMKSI